jgi:putative DNA primase/helicase
VTAFDSLADLERWVAWRNEWRGNKLTKVPYSPATGKAKADDAQTWGTRRAAEAKAATITNGLGGGIGIELGDLAADEFLGGVDLDSCIDPQGCLSLWAEKILCELDTYAECSPSGTGIKAFFYCATADVRPFLGALGVTDPDKWGIAVSRRRWSRSWPRRRALSRAPLFCRH